MYCLWSVSTGSTPGQFTSQDLKAIQTIAPPPSKKMVSLIQYCSTSKLPLIIGCDVNSHHPCRGSRDSNERGNALLEYFVTTDLIILNNGTKPTSVAAGRQTIIDITLASSGIASFVTEWRVSDEESLSDHRYITFQIQAGI